MSRVGNRILRIPQAVTAEKQARMIIINSTTKKEIVNYKPEDVQVVISDGCIMTKPANSSRQAKMSYGTINVLLANALVGVVEGFEKHLKIVGVGYKAALHDHVLVLHLGYSKPVELKIPLSLNVLVISPTELKVQGSSKELVGQFASQIRGFRPPEPYKGKGIFYHDETIVRKVGKTAEGSKGKKGK